MDKVTLDRIRVIVEMEGLEYAVCNYLSAENIEDKDLAMLWEQASNSMIAVENYLKAHGGWPEV